MTGSARFSFHPRGFLRNTCLSLATTDTHCPLPTPTPGGCFTELILAVSRPPDSGRQAIGVRGCRDRGHCRGQPAGEIAAYGKAPSSTPGPRSGRPRAGRGVGAREAGACSFPCLPRPSAATVPSINVYVERRIYPHPREKIQEGRGAADAGGGGVASHWRFLDHHFIPVTSPYTARRKVTLLSPESSRVWKEKKRQRC